MEDYANREHLVPNEFMVLLKSSCLMEGGKYIYTFNGKEEVSKSRYLKFMVIGYNFYDILSSFSMEQISEFNFENKQVTEKDTKYYGDQPF
jgi:hypothetical protein